HAGNLGGAIYLLGSGNSALNATGNVTFSGNTQGPASRANAIYAAGAANITFNPSSGQAISFRDPIAGGNSLATVTKDGAGLLSFDGSDYTNAADRQSAIYAATQVNAGTFEVANNAVYGEHASDAGGANPSTFTTAPGTILQGGIAGTVITDQFT